MTTRCQQDEIYAAEENVRRGMWFDDEADVQAWMDALRDTWWWQRFFWRGPARVEVYWRDNARHSVGSYDRDRDGGVVEMRPQHRNELIMLHELAHVIASAMNDSQAHDPFFARTYATLVYCVLGSDAWLELQHGFEEYGVEYMQEA